MSDTKFVLPLDSADATLAHAGGKGHNLSELVRGNFPVPPGFIITTAAYHAFVEANNLNQALVRFESQKDFKDIEKISQEIFELFRVTAIPEAIEQEIARAYTSLMQQVERQTPVLEYEPGARVLPGDRNPLAVAVRSSGTTEDLADFSYAGLGNTYLNIQGDNALFEAVKACWASLWNTRAVMYRQNHPGNSSFIGQAVVIQKMIEAEKSGVLFTINPLTGSNEETLINATWGLGESIVSGRVNPDSIVIDNRTNSVKQVDVSDKEWMTVFAEHGTIEVPVEARHREAAVLGQEEATRLSDVATSIATFFGNPQDIEWAIYEDELFILQSRPITAVLSKKKAAIAASRSLEIPGDDDWPVLGAWQANPFDAWTRANVGELWREPVSPLVASTVPGIISGAVTHSFHGVDKKILARIQWAKRFYGRIYYNEGALKHIISSELGLPATVLDKTRGNVSGGKSKKRKLKIARILLHLPVLQRLATSHWSSGRELKTFMPKISGWLAEFLNSNQDELSDIELWNEAMKWVERTRHALKLQNDLSGYSQTAVSMLEWLTVRWFKRRDLALDLISGIPGIEAAEIGTSLWKMAKMVKELDLVPIITNNDSKTALLLLQQDIKAKPVMDLLDLFLREHGYRCPNEAEWLHPRWMDSPELVIELLKGYLDQSANLDLSENKALLRQTEALAWIESRLKPWSKIPFHYILKRAQHAVLLRDNGKSHAIKASYPARCISLHLGRRWVDRGWLREPEDFFFLTVPDIQQIIEKEPGQVPDGFNFFNLIDDRRKAFIYWFDVEAPHEVDWEGNPVTAGPVNGLTDQSLKGISVSSGRVSGRARIIYEPAEALKMTPDEILITRATDAGWSAVFPLIAGLVTEIGGQLSHSAILAREYNLPAIVNVYNATSKIRDGQFITLDCATACIYLDQTS